MKASLSAPAENQEGNACGTARGPYCKQLLHGMMYCLSRPCGMLLWDCSRRSTVFISVERVCAAMRRDTSFEGFELFEDDTVVNFDRFVLFSTEFVEV